MDTCARSSGHTIAVDIRTLDMPISSWTTVGELDSCPFSHSPRSHLSFFPSAALHSSLLPSLSLPFSLPPSLTSPRCLQRNAFLIGPIKSILQKMSTCCKLQLLGRLLLHKLTLQLGEWQSVIDDRSKLAHDLLYMLLTCRCRRCSGEIGSKLIIRLV